MVTRVASDGFYVTDLADQNIGYNAIFAYNFSTPADMRVCDTLTYLAGTANDFFGFTELSFPSYQVANYDPKKAPCPVRATALVAGEWQYSVSSPRRCTPDDGSWTEKLRRGEWLVRLQSGLQADGMTTITWTMPTKLGPGIAMGGAQPTATNCDFNGDGKVGLHRESDEGGCFRRVRGHDPECSEWIDLLVARRDQAPRHGARKDPKTGMVTSSLRSSFKSILTSSADFEP